MRSNVGCGCHKVHCKFIILEKKFTKIQIQINTLHTVKWIVLHLMACIWTVSKYVPHKDHLWIVSYFVPQKHHIWTCLTLSKTSIIYGQILTLSHTSMPFSPWLVNSFLSPARQSLNTWAHSFMDQTRWSRITVDGSEHSVKRHTFL